MLYVSSVEVNLSNHRIRDGYIRLTKLVEEGSKFRKLYGKETQHVETMGAGIFPIIQTSGFKSRPAREIIRRNIHQSRRIYS
jgi:hypothetical protein